MLTPGNNSPVSSSVMVPLRLAVWAMMTAGRKKKGSKRHFMRYKNAKMDADICLYLSVIAATTGDEVLVGFYRKSIIIAI
jgi:hypothetical protein